MCRQLQPAAEAAASARGAGGAVLQGASEGTAATEPVIGTPAADDPLQSTVASLTQLERDGAPIGEQEEAGRLNKLRQLRYYATQLQGTSALGAIVEELLDKLARRWA